VESNHLLHLDLQSKGPRPSERKRIYSPLPTALQEPFSCLIFIRFFGTTSAKAIALTHILHHTISIRIFRARRYATRCAKKESPMNGSNGISFPTHLPAMQKHGTRLRTLKLKAIGTSLQISFARSSFQLARFNI
jgi:hypothetical protein